MIRQSISKTLLIVYIACVVISGKDNAEERIEEAKMDYVLSQNYCTMDELIDMDYYLFCYTEISSDVGPTEYASVVLNSNTKTFEEARELYRKFIVKLPFEKEETGKGDDGEPFIFYISPDCKWSIALEWNEHQTQSTQTLFYEKEEIKKVVEEGGVVDPIVIVKDKDAYKEMEEQCYERLSEIKRNESDDYFPLMMMNVTGDLIVGADDYFQYLAIRKIEDGTEQWRFSLQGIQEEIRKIRDDLEEDDSYEGVYIRQFEGDVQEGYILVQAGLSSFFKITYPSGKVTYLGEYLYSPSFSPDGKYLAYSGVDYDNVVCMELEEEYQLPPPGIYVMEIETGKTAYIYWDRLPEERSFIWLEKESFEKYIPLLTVEEP